MIVMRLPWLSVLGAVVWAVSSPASAADSFTVGVLSCAAEGDRDRRLDCYDRAVASFTARLTDGKRESGAAPAPSVGKGATTTGAAGAVGAAGAGAAAAVPVAASGPPPPSAASAPGVSAAASARPPPAATSAPAANDGKPAPSAARHVAARIVSIEHFPDYVVVHLDNQQIWKQVSESPGGPALRTGDPVTIDKEMGSYWLSGAKGEAVQVKLQTPKQ
jgi:hypothetical protein